MSCHGARKWARTARYSCLPMNVPLRFTHPGLLVLDTTVALCVQRGREFLHQEGGVVA